MATYNVSDYDLFLNMGDTFFRLDVLDNEDNLVQSFDLMQGSNSVTLAVEGDKYVIGNGDTIQDDDEPHKHQMGGSNSQSIVENTLTGIGIMDLRDMGRQGQFTTTYDLACGSIRLDGKSGAYPLWIKVSDTTCVDVQPPV